jgi:hypothetical protein
MAGECCKVVGNVNLCAGNVDLGCVLSINVSSRLEILKKCGNSILIGSVLGTVSITAYATSSIYTGCPSKANVSIQWLKRLDCDADRTYFIAAGEGPAAIAGNIRGNTTLYYVDGLGNEIDIAVLNASTGKQYGTISASSSSGPAAIYMHTTQVDGYGLTYVGGPIAFDTSLEADPTNPESSRSVFVEGRNVPVYSTLLPPIGVRNGSVCEPLCGDSVLYLQSFSLDMNPGEIPIATYSYNFVIDDIDTEIPLNVSNSYRPY